MAEGQEDIQLEDFFMEYHPYNKGGNPMHTKGSDSQTLSYLKQGKLFDDGRKTSFEKRIKTWLDNILTSDNSPEVIMIAPGHNAGAPTNNLLYGLLGSVLAKIPQVTDGRVFLQRTEDVPKSTDGGRRDQRRHEETISLIAAAAVINKVVYIFDDVYTSGATLRACANVVKRAEASNVKIFAVGKTISQDYDY
jgi:phosphoribosylpyrophosphate synthetase